MDTKLQQRVMASVLVIWAARKLVGITALKIYVLALAALGIVSLVSVPHVAANLMAVHGLSGLVNFMLAAILNTKLVVQLSLVAGSLALASLFVGFVRPAGASARIA